MNTKTRSTKTGALPAFLTRDPYITRLVLVLVLLPLKKKLNST